MSRIKRAIGDFEAFTGERPRRVTRSRLPDGDQVGWKMGRAVGVAYEATRDGITERYFHEFKKKAAPDLVAGQAGRQLYFDGGRYHVTERGIEDMPQLFVVNPSKRPSKRKTAMARSRRRRRTHHRSRSRGLALFRANPIRRRRRRRYTARRRHTRRAVYLANPIRRRRRRRMSVRRYRRNPSARRLGGAAVTFSRMLLPAAGIGLGAVGSEIIMGYLPIPAQFKTGVARHFTKGAVGVTAGLVLGKLFRMRRLGNYFALGAVAIAVHDAVKELIANRMPSVHMGMGMYRRPIHGSLGYSSPAQTLRIGQYMPPVHSSFAGYSTNGQGGGEMNARV